MPWRNMRSENGNTVLSYSSQEASQPKASNEVDESVSTLEEQSHGERYIRFLKTMFGPDRVELSHMTMQHCFSSFRRIRGKNFLTIFSTSLFCP